MSLPCGCEMVPGAPVSFEIVKAHYKHTLQVLLFWELIRRSDRRDVEDRATADMKLKLSQARIALIECIEKLYPEAVSQ